MKETTLKTLREENKKTAAEVAAALNTTVSVISHYECGIRRINIEQVLVLAKMYETTAEEIIEAQLKSVIRKSN